MQILTLTSIQSAFAPLRPPAMAGGLREPILTR